MRRTTYGRLSPPWSIGETKCICRNEYAVHEQVGNLTHQHLSGHAGLVSTPGRSTCACSSASGQAFHLNDNGRQSIQFFDPRRALLKVYATGKTDMAAWQTLVAKFRRRRPALTIRPADRVKYADSADAAALENEWRALTDVPSSLASCVNTIFPSAGLLRERRSGLPHRQ